MNSSTRRNFMHSVTIGLLGGMALPASAVEKSRTMHEKKDSHNATDSMLLGKKTPPLQGKDFKLHKDAARAYDDMAKAARKDGLVFYSASSYRSFENQKQIWNNKFTKLKSDGLDDSAAIERIVQYSSIPGTSRHHWGTDIDIVLQTPNMPEDPMLEEFFQEGQMYGELYRWLKANAESFGFREVYTNDPTRTGYAYEPWHWSYAELSIPFLKQYLQIDLTQVLKDKSVKGSGNFTEEFIERFTKNWILGINKSLIPT